MYYNNQQMTSTYTYVNGLEGVKAYQLMPNQSILLMDTNEPYFYLKTSNQMGQATIRCFKFEECALQDANDKKYASVESVNEINAKLDKLLNELKGDKE